MDVWREENMDTCGENKEWSEKRKRKQQGEKWHDHSCVYVFSGICYAHYIYSYIDISCLCRTNTWNYMHEWICTKREREWKWEYSWGSFLVRTRLFKLNPLPPILTGVRGGEMKCLGIGYQEKMSSGQWMWMRSLWIPGRLCCWRADTFSLCWHSAESHPSRSRGERARDTLNWTNSDLHSSLSAFCRIDHKPMGTMVFGICRELGSFLQSGAAFSFLMKYSLKLWHFSGIDLSLCKVFSKSGVQGAVEECLGVRGESSQQVFFSEDSVQHVYLLCMKKNGELIFSSLSYIVRKHCKSYSIHFLGGGTRIKINRNIQCN